MKESGLAHADLVNVECEKGVIVGEDAAKASDDRNDMAEPNWKKRDPLHENAFLSVLRAYYFPFLLRFNKHICFTWLAVFVICVVFGPQFLSSTRSNLDLPAGTPSEAAVNAFTANYPDASSWPPAIILFHSNVPGQSVINSFTRDVSKKLDDYANQHSDVISGVSGYWEQIDDPETALLAYRSVSANNQTAIATVYFSKSTTLTKITQASHELLSFASGETSSDIAVSCTGTFPLFAEMSDATESSLLTIDAVVIPLAILILGFTVRSYRHMGVALCNLACALLLAFAVLVPVSNIMDVNPFTPSIMQSIGIAVCFDYSLFMLTRFREERIVHRKSKEDAVFACLAAAGHVVCLSGTTLFAAFLLLVAFPQNFLQSVGAGCATAVFTAILSNMSLTPSLLLAFDCLSHFDLFPSRTSFCCMLPPPPPDSALPPSPAGDIESGTRSPAPAPPPLPQQVRAASGEAEPSSWTPAVKTRASMWFRFSYAMTRYSYLVLLVVAGITVPFAISFFRMSPTSDDAVIYLEGSQSKNALGVMSESFPVGSLNPYSVIITTGRAGAVFTEEYFTVESVLIANLLATQQEYLTADTVKGVSFYNGRQVSLATAQSYFDPTSAAYTTPLAGAYRSDVKPLINQDKSTSMVHIETTIPPTSQAIVPFITSVRAIIDGYTQSSPAGAALPVQMYLFGGYTTTLDVQNALYAEVPIEIGITAAVVLLLVGTSFGSVGVALRLVLTIVIDLCWTYGFMVLVYQPGPDQDNFARLTPSLHDSPGIYWIIPVMSFSILVGLALDYDIFLMTRIVEFRRKGWSDRAAVCLAVERTGGIITAAGVIMCISFGGLFIPKTVVLNQYAFSLFMGVLIDTFFTRPVLVPAIISALGGLGLRVNWWPMRMPPVALAPEDEMRALAAGLWEPRLVDSDGNIIPAPPPPSPAIECWEGDAAARARAAAAAKDVQAGGGGGGSSDGGSEEETSSGHGSQVLSAVCVVEEGQIVPGGAGGALRQHSEGWNQR